MGLFKTINHPKKSQASMIYFGRNRAMAAEYHQTPIYLGASTFN
jgi:hypothetical protein